MKTSHFEAVTDGWEMRGRNIKTAFRKVYDMIENAFISATKTYN